MSDGEGVTADEVDADEVWQGHIYAPDTDFTVHLSIVVDQPEHETSATSTGDTRQLALSEGGNVIADDAAAPTPSDDWPFVHQGAGGEVPVSRTVMHRRDVAMGYYLHHLETHGLGPESDIHGDLQAIAEEQPHLPLSEYYEWTEQMDPSDRRLRLLDLGEFRSEDGGDWAAKPYLTTCTWRSTDLGEQGKSFAERLWNGSDIELNTQHCYRNAQQVAIKHADNHHVRYVEGLALPKQCAQSIRHAWIEYDGEVVEVTWPWHLSDGAEAVYFGTEYDAAEVEETFDRRNGGSQMILSDEQIADLKDKRSP